MTSIGVLLIAGFTYAFWPHPLIVDMGQTAREPMILTINEEAKMTGITPLVLTRRGRCVVCPP